MIYEFNIDTELYENIIKKKGNIILADATNVDEIEYKGLKKKAFHTCVLKEILFDEWPNVEFYFDSQKGDEGLDYLWNVNGWPVIHKKIMNRFIEMEISGVEYYPIKLIDKRTGSINNEYVLMYVRNFIEAYDMKKSEYDYFEKMNVYVFKPHGIAMDQEECNKYDIFRCNKFVPIIYVSQRVRDEIISNGWIGLKISETRGGRYCG